MAKRFKYSDGDGIAVNRDDKQASDHIGTFKHDKAWLKENLSKDFDKLERGEKTPEVREIQLKYATRLGLTLPEIKVYRTVRIAEQGSILGVSPSLLPDDPNDMTSLIAIYDKMAADTVALARDTLHTLSELGKQKRRPKRSAVVSQGMHKCHVCLLGWFDSCMHNGVLCLECQRHKLSV